MFALSLSVERNGTVVVVVINGFRELQKPITTTITTTRKPSGIRSFSGLTGESRQPPPAGQSNSPDARLHGHDAGSDVFAVPNDR
jgi:hypothetical protein